ncbi:MAG: hypothetical protein EPN75_11300 [Beijerinckiaceae bacterium]|nr:MAG: hypothetical protein EPN75_11300 [Beijerinckiaceae bacterium]
MVLLGFATLSIAPAQAQTVACQPPVVVSSAPPPLPVYEQPPLPGPGYVWTPGYWSWSYDDEDYYWVPGTWVEPPRAGLLWTPGYWGWAGGSYLFHHGYWGTRVGYYGGIHYGHGYTGEGYEGGRWRDGHFFYNRSVTNITTKNITNVYEKTVIVNRNVNRVSFNGGNGGTKARETKEQRTFARQQHFAPTVVQEKNVTAARNDKSLSNKANHGRPPVAATAHPAQFKGTGVVPSRHEGEANPANGAHPESMKPGMTKPGAAQPGTIKPEGRGHGAATPESGQHGVPNSQNGRHEQNGQHNMMKPGEKTAPGNQQGKPAMTPEHRGANGQHPGANEKMRGHGAVGGNKPAATPHEKPGMRGGNANPAMRQERPSAQPAGRHAAPNHAQPRPQGERPAPGRQAPMQMQHRQAPAQMQRHEPNHPPAAPHNGGERGRPQAHGPANAHPNQGGGHRGEDKRDERR